MFFNLIFLGIEERMDASNVSDEPDGEDADRVAQMYNSLMGSLSCELFAIHDLDLLTLSRTFPEAAAADVVTIFTVIPSLEIDPSDDLHDVEDLDLALCNFPREI